MRQKIEGSYIDLIALLTFDAIYWKMGTNGFEL